MLGTEKAERDRRSLRGDKKQDGYSGRRQPPEPTWEDGGLFMHLSGVAEAGTGPPSYLTLPLLALGSATPDLTQASHLCMGGWMSWFPGRTQRTKEHNYSWWAGSGSHGPVRPGEAQGCR